MFGTHATGSAEGTELVSLRDAQAAGYAADGYCRATGEAAVVLSRGTVEALQLASALLTSWGDRLPVVAVTRVPDADVPLVRAAFGAVTQAQLTVLDEQGLEPLSQLPPQGPVHVMLSGDLPAGSVLRSLRITPHHDREADPEQVREAAQLLRGCKRPLLLIGRGAVGIDPHLAAELGRVVDCPVLLTASASTMPAATLDRFRRAFAVDAALVPSGNLVWVKALAQADGVLALGTALSEVDWFGLSSLRLARGRVVRVGLQPGSPELAHQFIRAEVGAFLRQLLDHFPSGGAVDSRRVAKWRQASAAWREQVAQEAEAAARLPHVEPCLAAHTIVAGAPEDTLFISEGGACGMWLWSYLWLRPLVFPVQHGTIGVPVPMALGALVDRPGRPVWCVVGDGAFFYNARELCTLREGGHCPVFFVFNDSCWSAIRLGQTAVFGGRYVGTDLAATDYAEVAELHGCEGLTVRTPQELSRAVARAREDSRRVPLVVDIHLNKDHIPYAGASFVLAEFDGVLGSLLPGLVLSTGLGLARGSLSVATLRSLMRVSRQ